MTDINNTEGKKYTSIKKLKRKGKVFSPPYECLEYLTPIEWDRDLLPEFIWMDGLHHKFNNFKDLYQKFQKFIDMLESYIDTDEINLLGLISDFALIPEGSRDRILRENKEIIKELFIDTVGEVLLLYPECPALWLIPEEEKENLNKDTEHNLKKLLNVLGRLYPGKESEYCRELRILPLQRLFKHKKISFTPQIELPKLLLKYPDHLTKEEKEQCERMAILTINMCVDNTGSPDKREYHWSKHFWNHNLKLSPCVMYGYMREKEYVEITEDFVKQINEYTEDNVKSLKKYLFEDLVDFNYNLYDPTKDEVVVGLFSRILRLCIAFLKAPELWAGDLSKIFIRCILDSTIVLKYLLKENDIELFQKFIEYGRGKEKLQILHSQDTYPNEKSAGSEDANELAIELGSDIFIEALQINVGNWIDKSVRDMAIECNMHKEYALIYNPTSEDVHGSWSSINRSSLMKCMNPFHRFHKIPRIYEHLNPDLFDIMINIVEDAIKTCIKDYNFPKFNYTFKRIKEIVEQEKN